MYSKTVEPLPFSSVDALIRQLRIEMMSVPAESTRPFIPAGGMFGLPFSDLPLGDERSQLLEAVTVRMKRQSGIELDRVIITDTDQIEVWVMCGQSSHKTPS